MKAMAERIESLMGDYNRDIIPAPTGDYAPGSGVSLVRLSPWISSLSRVCESRWDVWSRRIPGATCFSTAERRPTWLRTPSYTILKQRTIPGSNPFTMRVLGTDIKITVSQLDSEDVRAIRGSAYSHSEGIIPYPERFNEKHNWTPLSRGSIEGQSIVDIS